MHQEIVEFPIYLAPSANEELDIQMIIASELSYELSIMLRVTKFVIHDVEHIGILSIKIGMCKKLP